jgi:hypothetical protein
MAGTDCRIGERGIVAEAGRCRILTDESRVALRAAFIRGRKRRTAAARGIVAQRLHEVVADLADEIAGLRDSGMLASRQ